MILNLLGLAATVAACFALIWFTPRRPRVVSRFIGVYIVGSLAVFVHTVFDHDWLWAVLIGISLPTLVSWWVECRQNVAKAQIAHLDLDQP